MGRKILSVAGWTAAVYLLLLPPWVGAQVPWTNPLKEKLKAGKAVIGATVTVGHPEIASTLAIAGFDFFWFEGEHSPLNIEKIRAMTLATRGLDTVPITRVPYNEPWLVKRALDAGSLGVIFPFTSTKELAEKAVRACKYPPEGIRGFGPGMALSRWNVDGSSYIKYANQNVMVIVMIEQEEAVNNIEEIASVPGIDVLYIGPADLSFSLGVGGQMSHPSVEEAIQKVLAVGKRHNLIVGLPGGSTESINRRIREGFRFFQSPSDLGLLRRGVSSLLDGIEGRDVPSRKPGTLY